MKPEEKARAASSTEALRWKPKVESWRKGKKIAPKIRTTLAKAAASVRSTAPARAVISTARQRRQRRRPPSGGSAARCSVSQYGQARRSSCASVSAACGGKEGAWIIEGM
jgi:hypothetical protein